MRRRGFIGALSVALALPRFVRAQTPMPVIGILFSSRATYPGPDHPLMLGLREVGLVDAKTATIIVRDAEGDPERLSGLAAELIAAKPDVLVSAGPQPIAALKRATATIPIVMSIVSDPVAYGFVQSLAHPGGNLTGLSMLNTELSSKRIQLLREVMPDIARVAVFTDPSMGPQGLAETTAAARTLGLDLQVLPLTAEQIAAGFADAEKGKAQALLIMPTPFYNFTAVRQRLGALAVQYHLPSMCESATFVRDGCLMSYGPDFAAMFRRSAVYVDKILKGAKPADLPIEQPTKFDLVINLRTAKTLGLTMPQLLLARVDEVIE